MTHPRHPGLLLTVLCVPMFLVLLDVMAMNVAMPSLGSAFGVPVGRWPQVVDAYTVPLAAGLLPGGWLADRFGARRILMVGLVAFVASSIGGGLAGGWTTVLVARTGQGLGAALMLPAGLSALTLTWREHRERARVLGIWSGVSAVATALGPAVGGVLVQGAGWRMVFWVNVPLAALAGAGTMLLLRVASGTASEVGRPGSPGSLVASVVAAGMMTSGANGTLQVVTVHLQHGVGLGAGVAGAILLLATAPFVVLGPVSGWLVTRCGRREIATTGLVLGGIGLATVGRIPGIVGLVPGLLGIGIGLGLMTSAIVGETMASWPARPGLAGGLNNASRQIGTSCGVAVGGIVAARFGDPAMLPVAGTGAALWWLAAAVVVWVGFARKGIRAEEDDARS